MTTKQKAHLHYTFRSKYSRRTLYATNFEARRACERHFDMLAIAKKNDRHPVRKNDGGQARGNAKGRRRR